MTGTKVGIEDDSKRYVVKHGSGVKNKRGQRLQAIQKHHIFTTSILVWQRESEGTRHGEPQITSPKKMKLIIF